MKLSTVMALTAVGTLSACSPSLAQPNLHHQAGGINPLHSTILVPGVCTETGFVDNASWITVRGQHALSITSSAGFDSGAGGAGFELYGNTESVLHHVLPNSLSTSGRLPTGNLTFDVISTSASGIGLSVATLSNTGTFYDFPDILLLPGQKVTVPINNPGPGQGDFPAFFGALVAENTIRQSAVQAILTDFRFNGVPLHLSTETDRRHIFELGTYCGFVS